MKLFHVNNAPCDTIYIGRSTPYGNPYVIGKDGSRKQVVEQFRLYAERRLKEEPRWLDPLRGNNIKCHCAPKFCHGNIYLEILGARLNV